MFCIWFPLLCKKLLSLIRSHLFVFVFVFVFVFFGLRRQFPKSIAVIHVKECSAYVFL